MNRTSMVNIPLILDFKNFLFVVITSQVLKYISSKKMKKGGGKKKKRKKKESVWPQS